MHPRRILVREGVYFMRTALALLAGVALLAGCSGEKKEEAPAATGGDTTAATTTTAGTADGLTGVAECDDYMNKVMACIKDKVPEAQRAAMEQALQGTKSQWAAVTDKAALAQSCKTAMESAKASYAAMGCTF